MASENVQERIRFWLSRHGHDKLVRFVMSVNCGVGEADAISKVDAHHLITSNNECIIEELTNSYRVARNAGDVDAAMKRLVSGWCIQIKGSRTQHARWQSRLCGNVPLPMEYGRPDKTDRDSKKVFRGSGGASLHRSSYLRAVYDTP